MFGFSYESCIIAYFPPPPNGFSFLHDPSSSPPFCLFLEHSPRVGHRELAAIEPIPQLAEALWLGVLLAPDHVARAQALWLGAPFGAPFAAPWLGGPFFGALSQPYHLAALVGADSQPSDWARVFLCFLPPFHNGVYLGEEKTYILQS